MSSVEDLAHLVRPAAGEPEGALVLLHGRGADERDLHPLLDLLDPARRLVGVTPRGPLRMPPGGAHWYAVREIGFPDPATFGPTFPLLAGWLGAFEREHGLDPTATVLGGFSQGAVMSHALTLSTGEPRRRALIALSGFVPTVEGLELDPARARGLPVLLAHGAHDPVIGVEWGRRARELYEPAGAALTYREAPIGHQIDPGLLREAPGWLERALDEAPAPAGRPAS